MEKKNIFHENPVEVRSFDGTDLMLVSKKIQSCTERKIREMGFMQSSIHSMTESGVALYQKS
jgi:hypothetical protein